MDLTKIISNSLKTNIQYGAGTYISPDGILNVTWLPDENAGYIDIKNPKNLNYKDLKAKSLKYIKALPPAKWEFNPDTPQKGRIYQRLFKGIAKPNPNMPNNALIFDTSSKGSSQAKNNLKIKVKNPNSNTIKLKGNANLKIGAGGSNTYSKQLNSPGKFGFDDEVFNHMNLENYHKIITPGGVFPRV